MFTGTPSPLRVRVPAGFLRVLARNPGFPTPWRLPRVAHLPMWRIPKSPPPPMIDVSRTPHPRWRITDRWDHMIEPRFSPLQTTIRPGDRFVHPSDPPRTRNMFRGSVTSSWPGTEPCLPPEGKTGPSHLFRRALPATSCPRLARLRLRQYCLECDVPMWTQRGVTEVPHTGSD